MQNQVPCLTTALTGPLLQLEKLFLAQQCRIENWLRKTGENLPLPLTCSVDIRNAGFKVAPVDTNLFPAGYNNLNRAFLPLCIQAIQNTLQRHYARCMRIIVIPESHTRNTFYLESLSLFQEMLTKAGYEVRLGSLRDDVQQNESITLPSGKIITLEPIRRVQDRIWVGDFNPCLIILNNDLSDGLPSILESIQQPITPPTGVGWYTRLKSTHFSHYQSLATEFSDMLGIDPWLINPLFDHCADVDIARRQGESELQARAETLFAAIRQKYQANGIDRTPYVVLKADAGSYGMGVMMITDPGQIATLNRKQRSKMATTKGGRKITQVLLQEGVHSIETVGPQQAVAEPVVYLIGPHVVGGFYRVHTARAADENLNAPGMHFEPLAFMDCCINPDITAEPDAAPNRFYAYGVIARLAMLAAAKEIKQVEAEGQ